MLFPLKFQRNNRKNALAMGSAKGEILKNLHFHCVADMKQPYAMTEPSEKALYICVYIFASGRDETAALFAADLILFVVHNVSCCKDGVRFRECPFWGL